MILLKLQLEKNSFDIKIATNFIDRLMGFMGKTNIQSGILFPKCNSVHTFFMKEEIDIIGLDSENTILFIERNCAKNKIIRINHSIKKTSILELPKNTSFSLNVGDTIHFIQP